MPYAHPPTTQQPNHADLQPFKKGTGVILRLNEDPAGFQEGVYKAWRQPTHCYSCLDPWYSTVAAVGLDELQVMSLLPQVPEPHRSITAAESHQVGLVRVSVQAMQAHMISRTIPEV